MFIKLGLMNFTLLLNIIVTRAILVQCFHATLPPHSHVSMQPEGKMHFFRRNMKDSRNKKRIYNEIHVSIRPDGKCIFATKHEAHLK